ncbi:MAG: hypothetical protein JWP29_45 [Rhodoferax sp.]|nr:hypothetical protein [Rhodoferax sp.]
MPFRLEFNRRRIASSTAAAALLALLACAPAMAQTAAPAATPAAPAASAPDSRETAEKEAAGQLAAQGWLLLLDRQNWGGAWDAASQVFRTMVPIDAWMGAIPKDRAPLGPLVTRTPTTAVYKTTLQGRPDGEYVTAVFATEYTNKKGLEEVVTTVREPDGRWRVTGYFTR